MADKMTVNNMISKRIIAFVKKNPILYEPTGPFGKNLRLKDKKWMELVPQLGLSLSTIKYKWRNIRDSYSRHIKATSSEKPDSLSIKYRNWLWSKHMEFMRPYVNVTAAAAPRLPIPTSEKSNEETGIDEDESEEETEPKQAAPATAETHDDEDSEEEIKQKPKIIKGRPEMRRFQRVTVPKPQQRPIQRQNLDAIDHIFLGYAKTVKTFSPRRQVLVKMEIAKVMMQAEMEELQDPVNPLDVGVPMASNHVMTAPLHNGLVCKQQVESDDENYNEML